MSDSKLSAATNYADVPAARDRELGARFEHLRALNSAWAVLAHFGLPEDGCHIVETGRAVRAQLAELAGQPLKSRDTAALPKLDRLLDGVQREMLTLAFEVPVAELRASLPARLATERRGILDLLDLMLVPEIEGHYGSPGRISAIDYLITLLCTGGDDGGGVLQDPAGLTPGLYTLSERASEADDPRLEEIESEFYAAADLCEKNVRDDNRLRALRRRKRDLGPRFFAPSVLRAIITYNAALSRCLRRGAWDSRDWGSLPDGEEPAGSEASVFETETLPRLAAALRRRAEGDAPTSSAIDRVAWCLDLPGLGGAERIALLSPSVGRPENLEGTAILVGLLCHSAIVLEGEFPAIGIPPEKLSSGWVRELDHVLQREVNRRVADNAYQEACALSELRTRFLYSLPADARRERRRAEPVAVPLRFERVEREAQHLAGEALKPRETKTVLGRRKARKSRGPRPWTGFVRLAGGGTLLALLALALFLGVGDLNRMSGSELDRVSPYLAEGARNGEGQGPAFVGTVDDAWSQLAVDAQQLAATRLVEALRSQGVREIMIYDGERRLRIQALGQQSVRVLSQGPTEAPSRP